MTFPEIQAISFRAYDSTPSVTPERALLMVFSLSCTGVSKVARARGQLGVYRYISEIACLLEKPNAMR